MAALIRMPRAAWRRQPQGPVAVHPDYLPGLDHVFLPSLGGINAMDGGQLTRVGTPVISTGSAGICSSHSSSVTPNHMFAKTFKIPRTANAPYAALLVFSPTVINSAAYAYFSIGGLVNDGSPMLLINALNAGTNLRLFINFGYRTLSPVVVLSARKLYVFVITYTAGIATVFVNNIQVLSYAAADISNEQTVYYGGGMDSNIFLGAAWNQQTPTIGQAQSLSINPWQLFTSAPSRFYLIPSSGGGGPTTHDVALTLAYIAACQPAANAQFNAGITFATLAGAMSGKTAQFNTALSLNTNVSLTLAKALSTLATVQLDMTAAQSVAALNDAVAAITESITCSYTSSVTANLLASLSFGITQALISGTGGQLSAAIALALSAGTQASATAAYSADVSLLTTLQTALQAALSTTASLTLPAILTITIDGERLTDGDVSLALAMQAGMTTSATAILSAQLTLATHLLATPSGIASFQTALSLANTLSTAFTTGNTIQSALSLAVSLALADAATVSLGGSLSLGLVLNDLQAAIASFTASTEFPVNLSVPLSGGMAMEAGISLGWTLSMTSEGAYFEITVTLPTGRVIVIQASERMINLTANERLIAVSEHGLITSL